MKTMPKSTIEEKFRWISPILDKEISIKNMVKICPFSERTLKYWLANYKERGMDGLENKSRRPKSNPKETPIRIKERIIELRKDKQRCALKIKWKLEKEKIKIHQNTVHKIIKTEGLTRKYRIRKIRYKYVKIPLKPGELVEIDIKYVPKRVGRRRYYQYTAIDCSTRWRYLKVYDEQNKTNVIDFIKDIMINFPYKIKSVKTDNHAIFTNRYFGYYRSDLMFPKDHLLDKFCAENDIVHYLIDPGKPA